MANKRLRLSDMELDSFETMFSALPKGLIIGTLPLGEAILSVLSEVRASRAAPDPRRLDALRECEAEWPARMRREIAATLAETAALRERVSALDTARRKAEVLLAGRTVRAENAERALLSALTTAEFLYGIVSGEIRVVENHRTLEARQTLDRIRALAEGAANGKETKP